MVTPTSGRPRQDGWWDTHVAALKSAAGVAFLLVAALLVVGAWIKDDAERDWLQWLAPIVGAALGYSVDRWNEKR